MVCLSPRHAIAHLAFRVLDHDPALGALHEDDQANDGHNHDREEQKHGRTDRSLPSQFQSAAEGARQFGNDPSEDYQGLYIPYS